MMPLHPDLAAFLELVEMGRWSGKSQPLHELSVAQARSEFENTSLILDPSPPDAIEVQPLTFTGADGNPLPARLYRKPGRGHAAQPVILYFHGGGYVVGSLDSHDSVCRRLAGTSDYAVLAPAYRLAPEAPFPAAVDDALAAANWLVEQAPQLQLDAGQVVVSGDSVGATLAMIVAMTAVQAPQRLALRPAAQLLFYPVTDITRLRDSHRAYAEGYLLETRTLEWFYQHYMGAAGNRHDWRASPLQSTTLPALAPACVMLAEFDPLLDEGREWIARLEASGTPVTAVIQPGLTHDFLRMQGLVAEVEGIYLEVGRWLASR
jgi:acetyl esterase